MSKQCSEIFEETFRLPVCGCVRTCACGKTYYDTYNDYDWEYGELKALEKDPNAFPVDYAIGTMSVGGEEIVIGCDCDKEKKYEDFILLHARQLVIYLNKRSESLKEESESIKVKGEQE